MRAFALLTLCVVAVTAVPTDLERIVGGSVTTIEQYNSVATLLRTPDFTQPHIQNCAGVILNERSILTAGQCFDDGIDSIFRWIVRLGSTNAHSGGVTHLISTLIVHPEYNRRTRNNDIAILHLTSFIVYTDAIGSAQIGGYVIPEDETVQAVGWGKTSTLGKPSEELRDVELKTFNQDSCNRRYWPKGVTEQMVCAGWVGGGRGQCSGDTGGPLYHHNIVVGISSFSRGCGLGTFPGVYTRVSQFIPWIVANA